MMRTTLIFLLLIYHTTSNSILAMNASITVSSENGVAVFLHKEYLGMIKPDNPAIVVTNVKPGSHQLKLQKMDYNDQQVIINREDGIHYFCKAGKFEPTASKEFPTITVTTSEKNLQASRSHALDLYNSFENEDVETDRLPSFLLSKTAGDYSYKFPAPGEVTDRDDGSSSIIYEMPKFNGTSDQKAFMKYIDDNLQYPKLAAENGVQGKVLVSFVVNSLGDVVDIVIVRGVHPALDFEAIRVVRSSPKWIPGRQKEKPVSVRYTFPISFVLM